MRLISQSNAQAALAPYHDTLRACVEAAWAHWQEIRSHFPLCSRSGRRHVMHEFILQEVRSRFGDTIGVKISERGRFLLTMENIVLRFKWVNQQFQTSNFATPSAIAFDTQLRLPGVPHGVRLTIGYQVNELETELVGVFIILSRGKDVLWKYEIGKDDGAQVIMFPQEHSPARPGSRIRPKKPKTPGDAQTPESGTEPK